MALCRFLFLFLACVLLECAPARASGIDIGTGERSVVVDRGVALLTEEPGEALTADQVMQPGFAARWTPYGRPKVNLPGQRRPVWLRFTVRLSSPAADTWLLAIDWPLLQKVDFHLHDPGTGRWLSHLEGGLDRPGRQAMRDPAIVFPLEMGEGRTATVLLRAESDNVLVVPLALWERGAWQVARYDHGVAMGVLFGILGVMVFYNLSLYIFTREPSFRTYTGYLFAILGYELAMTGYGPLFFWSGNDWLNHRGHIFFACASFLAATIFFRRFLDLRHASQHLNWLSRGFVVFWSVLMAMAVFPLPLAASVAFGVGSIVVGIAGIYTSAYLAWKGSVPARYLLVAWASIEVATFVTTLAAMGVIEARGWENAQHFGFVVETVLLSMALADRIRRDRASREAAQRQSLELGAANRELARLSVTDGLTGVHNRRHLDDTLRLEFDRSSRSGAPLALLLVDIDHFKRINDSQGHLAGDEGLKLVATTLQSCAGRSTDLVARYGGEEFAVLLPSTDAASALEMAERVRRAVECLTWRVPMSVSVGVVARPAVAGQSVAGFIAEADRALYDAKAAGRNRVVLAGRRLEAEAPV